MNKEVLSTERPRGGKQVFLEKHEEFILALRNKGYSYQQICNELEKQFEVIVGKSTVKYFIDKKKGKK